MTAEILLRYLHFICIFAIVSVLVAEHLLLRESMTRKEIRRLSILDGIYGISAILLLIAGFTLWFGVGKPAEFYSKNWIFHLKIGMFVVIGVLSIFPTVFFMKNRKGESEEELVEVPKMIKMYIRIELLLIFLMPLAAGLMAKGIGYFGD